MLYNVLVKSQCFSGPVSQGCDHHNCFSTGMDFPYPSSLLPSLDAVFPMYFTEFPTIVDFFFSLWEGRNTKGGWSGRNSLLPARKRLWKYLFTWTVGLGYGVSLGRISR